MQLMWINRDFQGIPCSKYSELASARPITRNFYELQIEISPAIPTRLTKL